MAGDTDFREAMADLEVAASKYRHEDDTGDAEDLFGYIDDVLKELPHAASAELVALRRKVIEKASAFQSAVAAARSEESRERTWHIAFGHARELGALASSARD